MHSNITDKKLYKQIMYHRATDKCAGYYDPHDRLTVADIHAMFIEQGGLCYWSQVPMEMPSETPSLFQVSIDRVDCSQGHTRRNTVLVCKATNLARNNHDEKELLEWLEAVRKHGNDRS